MLFKNKIEYTKGMFVEIYGTEIKKVRLVLRIITGIAVVAAIAFMIYGAAARGFIMPGDFFNLGISILMALLCTFLPNLMARSQMKKCKKRGLLGERTLRFTEQVLTMTYEKEGRSTDIPLEELTKVTEFDNFIRITIGGRSTFLDKKRFEIGDAAAFVTWAEDKIAENAEKEEPYRYQIDSVERISKVYYGEFSKGLDILYGKEAEMAAQTQLIWTRDEVMP